MAEPEEFRSGWRGGFREVDCSFGDDGVRELVEEPLELCIFVSFGNNSPSCSWAFISICVSFCDSFSELTIPLGVSVFFNSEFLGAKFVSFSSSSIEEITPLDVFVSFNCEQLDLTCSFFPPFSPSSKLTLTLLVLFERGLLGSVCISFSLFSPVSVSTFGISARFNCEVDNLGSFFNSF